MPAVVQVDTMMGLFGAVQSRAGFIQADGLSTAFAGPTMYANGVDAKITNTDVPIMRLPRSRLSEAVEWMNPSFDAVATSTLDQHDLATLIWIMAKVKPNLKVSVLRVESYRQLYELFKSAQKRQEVNNPIAYQMLMVRLSNITTGVISTVAADLGFLSQWFVASEKWKRGHASMQPQRAQVQPAISAALSLHSISPRQCASPGCSAPGDSVAVDPRKRKRQTQDSKDTLGRELQPRRCMDQPCDILLRAQSARLCGCLLLNEWPSVASFEATVVDGTRDTIRQFLKLDVAKHSGRAVLLWPTLLRAAYPNFQDTQLEDMLLMLVLRCFWLRETGRCKLHFIEYFAGSAQLTLQCLLKGFRGLAFDSAYHCDHDCVASQGLRLWIDSMSQTVEESMEWFGTKCSSWVVLCRKPSKRCLANQYLGNLSKQWVLTGNTHMTITALMMYLSFLMRNIPVLEQPANSCMPKAEPLCGVLLFMRAKRVHTWHGSFGGPSPKPLQLLSPSGHLRHMKRTKPKATALASNLVRKHGENNKKLTGLKASLVASQQYSAQFGVAFSEVLGLVHK